MSCEELALEEDAVFAELVRAVEHRQRIDAKLAIYNEHWEGYEAALTELEKAVRSYRVAVKAIRGARSRHTEPVPS